MILSKHQTQHSQCSVVAGPRVARAAAARASAGAAAAGLEAAGVLQLAVHLAVGALFGTGQREHQHVAASGALRSTVNESLRK